jgi:DNA-binding MarR family transcriptional regulator
MIPMGLRGAYLSMHRQTNAHLFRHGVTADQFVCLVILSEEDGITQKELARRVTSDANTIREMLVLLEKQDLVARRPHPTDGRARIVTITTKGRQIFDTLSAELKPVQAGLTAIFQAEESRTLLDNLKRIEKAMTNNNYSVE